MTGFEMVQVGLLFCAGIGTPVVVLLVSLHHKSRGDRFDKIDGRLDHIDECLDRLRVTVAGSAVTRSEMDARLLNLREAVSADTNGLHERIMRLESRALAIAGGT